MPSGFHSISFPLGLAQGPGSAGFRSVCVPFGIMAPSTAVPRGGARSFFGWWLGGFSGYAGVTTSPWWFLNMTRKRRG